MRSLRYHSAGDDDAIVSLAEEAGEEQFELRVDDALRTAVAPPGPALSPAIEPPAEPGRTEAVVLSPREIQVRVRAGEDPEELAAHTGANLSRIDLCGERFKACSRRFGLEHDRPNLMLCCFLLERRLRQITYTLPQITNQSVYNSPW
jgi:hypothetical protein